MSVAGAKPKRLNELTDDGPFNPLPGGPHVKQAFVYEDRGAAPTVPLLRTANTPLRALGVLWHKIELSQMQAAPVGAPTMAGPIRVDGTENSQKGIWLANVSLNGPWGLSTLSVKDGYKVTVDVAAVQAAMYTDDTTRLIIDWVVAHELCHKLAVDHPTDIQLLFITPRLTTDNGYSKFDVPPADGNPADDFRRYCRGDPQVNTEIYFYSPRSTKEGKHNVLEYPLEPAYAPPGTLNKVLPEPAPLANGSMLNPTPTIHGVAHNVQEYKATFPADVDTTKRLYVYAHSGFLNDHVPEISAFQCTLDTPEAKQPDLKK